MSQVLTFARPIDGPSAWVRRDVRTEDWRVELSNACLDEIRHVVDELRAYPLPTVVLGAEDFGMPACREAMSRARDILASGVRFAIVDRLPMAEITQPRPPRSTGCCRAWLRARSPKSSTER